MSLVSNNSKKVFLCSNTKVNVTNKVDIILSPEFYWVRIFDIPVKSTTQARHVLPTLFEDILENVYELTYQVIKLEENKYLCFAYVNKKIYEEIKKSGISLSLVNSIYFAQNECQNTPQFISNNKSFLYTQEGILVKVPNGILTSAINLEDEIENINLSSNNVDIKLYNNVLSSKQIYTIISILLIIACLNFYKLFDYKNENKTLDNKVESIKQSNDLPSSMIRTNSILKKYKSITNKEKEKREFLEYVLSNKKFKLKSVDLNNDVFDLVFESTDKNGIKSFLSKKYKVLSSNMRALNLNVKVKL